MSDIAIRVENLSKVYNIGALKQRHDTLRDHLAHSVRSLFGRTGGSSHLSGQTLATKVRSPMWDRVGAETFWALNNISFEIKRGEVLGIVGRNGAGKSTLLKVLSRITDPSNGRIEIYGRVGSLLEVGTGFHPELTGRENVFLNGAILGMRKAEIARRFDEIVDFSGVEKFIDTPVKRYSSGMRVRLAFAVAAHLEPEILIVDEVLAVGDAEFQRKCLGKMENVAEQGRTVLFVSHNMGAVQDLCHKGITLQDGKIVFSGTSKEAIDYYLHNIEGGTGACRPHIVDLSKAPSRRVGCSRLLRRLELFTDGGKAVTGGLPIGASLTARIHFHLEKPSDHVNPSIAFDNLLGQRIFSAHSVYQPGLPQGPWIGEHTFVCEIPSLTLIPGEYKIKVSLDAYGSPADSIEDAARILIAPSDYYGTGKIPKTGIFVLKHSWHEAEVKRREEAAAATVPAQRSTHE